MKIYFYVARFTCLLLHLEFWITVALPYIEVIEQLAFSFSFCTASVRLTCSSSPFGSATSLDGAKCPFPVCSPAVLNQPLQRLCLPRQPEVPDQSFRLGWDCSWNSVCVPMLCLSGWGTRTDLFWSRRLCSGGAGSPLRGFSASRFSCRSCVYLTPQQTSLKFYWDHFQCISWRLDDTKTH